jgi:hypothetical protein
MDSERTSIVIIGVLALVFVIAIFDRLQAPLPQIGGETSGGMIASIIGGVMCLGLMAGWVFSGDSQRALRLRNLIIWGVVITLAVFAITLFGGRTVIQ